MGPVERATAGDFEIRKKLGEGATGAVFEAVCLQDRPEGLRAGQVVAIKRIRKRGYLEREIRALTFLSHPNIVRCYGAITWPGGEWEEEVGLICERLEGEDLAARLKGERKGLPWDEALRLLDTALDALVHAESQGVAHRDLKPSNLFLCADGTPKWIDFGLARRTGGAGGRTVSAAEGWAGTFDYMAPEFARMDGFAGDIVSDIFSFGVLVCEVLTGAKPFEPLGEHPEIAFFRRWAGERLPEPRWPRGVGYGLEGIGAFLMNCLEPDRAKRYGHFAQVRSALGGVRPRVWKTAAEEWEATGFLAEGGFSSVYRVRGLKTGREAALKRLHSRRHEWRFQREADLMQRLQKLRHAALPVFYEWWVEPEPEGRPCLAMEYLPGETLRERLLAESGGLPLPEVLTLFQRYLEGLAALHDAGMAHRDLKPSNLYAPAGRPEEGRLLDLGIACEKDGTLSMEGLPPGTLDYMAPEMVTQPLERGSPQSDLFALGYVLYEALTGRPAMARLPADEAAAVKVLVTRSSSEAEFCAAFTGFDHPVFESRPELALIIGRAMRFDPKRRYGGGEESKWNGDGARAMKEDLAALGVGTETRSEAKGVEEDVPPTLDPLEMTPPVPGLKPTPPPKRSAWGAWALLILAGVGLTLWGWWNRERRRTEAPVGVMEKTPEVEEDTQQETETSVMETIETVEAVSVPLPAPETSEEERSPESERVVILPKKGEAEEASVMDPSSGSEKPPEPVAEEGGAAETVETRPVQEVGVGLDMEQWRREMESGERMVEEWVAWLCRPVDPLRSLLPARFDPAAGRPGKIVVPVLTGDERLGLNAVERLRYERLGVWRMGVEEGFAKGAVALRALAGETKEVPELGQRIVEEAALMEWDGRWLPEIPEKGDSVLGVWRAFALAGVGGEEEGRRALGLLAEAARGGANFGPGEVAVAIRAAENGWRLYVRNILERVPEEVVVAGTGRARRDPVGAYRSAVERVRPAVAEEMGWLREVVGRVDAEKAVEWFGARAEGAVAGDWVMALPEWKGTPLERAARVWREKRGERRDALERRVWEHIRGTAPLPTRAEEIPAKASGSISLDKAKNQQQTIQVI